MGPTCRATSARRWIACAIGCLAVVAAPPARAQVRAAPAAFDSARKKVLGLDDIGRWRRVTGAALSPDGRWMSFVITPNDGDATLHFEQTHGPRRYDIAVGSAPVFSDDSRYAGYFVSPPSDPSGRRGTVGGVVSFAGPPRRFELLDLETGATYDVPDADTFEFSKGARFLAVRTNERSGGSTTGGADLVLRRLDSGVTQNIGNVARYGFDSAGTMLAYTVDAADRTGNGVYLVDLGTGHSRVLSSAPLDYDRLAWSPSGASLAVLRGDKKPDRAQRDNTLLVWRDVAGESPNAVEYDPSADPDFPRGEVLSELGELRWTRDASRIYVGLKAQSPERATSLDPQANVDIWHWNDRRVQSEQIAELPRDRRATLAAVFVVAKRTLVPLADSVMRVVTPTSDPRWAIGQIDTAYRRSVEWDAGKSDYYRVSTGDAGRTLIDSGVTRTMGSSPDGRWFLYLENKRIHAYDMVTGRNTILAHADTTTFLDATDDHPYETPIYGVAGWSADGASVILDDRYDLYRVPLDGGKIVNLTGGVGAARGIRFRLVHFGTADSVVDLSKPLLLSAYGEWTKQSGYFRLPPGGTPVALIYTDEEIGQAIKAANADRVLFTRQTFSESPDYWLTTSDFAGPRKVTDANPFVAEYAWGLRRLIDFENAKGQRLQGVLTLPAGYQPGKRYPMVVYVYETLSDTYHTFDMPAYDDRLHAAAYASAGYLVFEPDIVYETGKPGSSALDCVTSGVKKVVELGYADPARIGLTGHSWGGYETSYILTRSRLFAAGVAGAPPTDLTSFYNGIYSATGTLQQGISELGQVRMGTNPWDAPALYADQSPITHVRDLAAPLLILQGTADDVVDWHQGLELYAAARRWGKKVILLSYPGEQHHLLRRENELDFQHRMKEFFDHYLKGVPAPGWITTGVPQLRKGEPDR
jgi:dipeptidyl aminopeptidase/acylaminoacyl peptidase